MEGYGEFIWTDGKSYKGNWVNNEMNGEGTLVYMDGKIYKGIR